jgi:hypothetical protein
LLNRSPNISQENNNYTNVKNLISNWVSLNAICENIPNIEVSLEKAYSEIIFWRKDIRSLVASPSQTSL